VKKVTQILYISLFLCVIGIGTIVNFPGLKASASKVAEDNAYEAWGILIGLDYNDHIVGKYNFIDLNGYIKNVLGQRQMNGIVKLNCGKLVSVAEEFKVEYAAQNTLELYEFLQKEGIAFAYIQEPYEVCKYDSELPTGVEDYCNAGADTFLELLSEAGVPVVDMRSHLHTVLEADGKHHCDAFFSTDHHWKIETAFWAFTCITEYLEDWLGVKVPAEYTNPDNWQREVLEECMLGSNGRRSSMSFGGLDDLTLIYPKFKTEVVFSAPEQDIYRVGDFRQAYMDTSWLEGDNLYDMVQYNVYIGEDWEYTRQECINAPCDKKILVIKDSYFRPVQAFLGTVFAEVGTIDMRVFEGNVREYIMETDPDIVMICYNPYMLGTVNNFRFDE